MAISFELGRVPIVNGIESERLQMRLGARRNQKKLATREFSSAEAARTN